MNLAHLMSVNILDHRKHSNLKMHPKYQQKVMMINSSDLERPVCSFKQTDLERPKQTLVISKWDI
jgi:hypothetical protein